MINFGQHINYFNTDDNLPRPFRFKWIGLGYENIGNYRYEEIYPITPWGFDKPFTFGSPTFINLPYYYRVNNKFYVL